MHKHTFTHTFAQVLATDCPSLTHREDITNLMSSCVSKAFSSDLVVKSQKSFITIDIGSSSDGPARNLVRTDMVKLRLFQLLSSLPASHLSVSLHSNILKRTFQVCVCVCVCDRVCICVYVVYVCVHVCVCM